MYWHELDESERLALAKHIYLAAASVPDIETAKRICADAFDRAGGRPGAAEQHAQWTNADYAQGTIGVEAGDPD